MNDELRAVIGNLPMSTLAYFDGMSLDHDALDRVVAAGKKAFQLAR